MPGTEPRDASDVECRKCNESESFQAFEEYLHADSRQWDTSPRIALPVVALAVAATVVRRVTWPRSATSRETCPRSNAATATSTVTPDASVPSPVTVSLVSPDPRIPHADIIPDSRVQCQNCQEYGHTKVRCTKPHVDEDGGAGGGGGGFDPVDTPADFGAGGAGGEDWNNGPSGGW